MLAYAMLRDAAVAGLIGGIGAIGAVLLGFVLVRRMDELLAWAVIPLGVAYTVSLVLHGTAVDGGAPLVAAGLLLCTELAQWSLDEHQAIAAERDVLLRRGSALAVLAFAGLVAAGLVVAFSLVPASGLAWTVLGAAAAVGAVGLAVTVSRPGRYN